MTDAAVARTSRLDTLVDYARRAPGRCLAVVLALHVVIWTVLPALLSHNLQLDLIEDLALGREWQLGYWKHPPLPWWLADLAYRAVGDVRVVYLLGPLSAAACMFVVWLLGRDILGGLQALIAVLALEGSIGLFMLFDPVARRTLRTAGPWLMALAFLVTIGPNLVWLIDIGYLP